MRRKKNIKACHYAIPSNRYSHQTTIIPIEVVELEDNSFHLIVPVEIDGIQGDMIIDTGASVTVVDQQTFPDKVGEESTVQLQSGSVSGQINNVHILKAKHFKIGERKIRNMPLAGIDLTYVNEMYNKYLNRKIIGLLGCDFCVRYGVVINYQNKTLLLNSRKN